MIIYTEGKSHCLKKILRAIITRDLFARIVFSVSSVPQLCWVALMSRTLGKINTFKTQRDATRFELSGFALRRVSVFCGCVYL